PPRLGATVEIPYPATGTGDAVVLLTLTVNADGSVRSASATQGREPFASAAVRAASGFRFEPATRDGRPVAATIRFELTFRAPLPEPLPSPAGASPGNAVASRPAAKPPKPIEVTVRGQTLAPAVSSFSRAEVRQLS